MNVHIVCIVKLVLMYLDCGSAGFMV